ncbi:hypothetical protein [Tenacibaculum amylolyticum]|uniref:hypothetical protein n=1 Tax=Tenacibaculum amylolyticum TaxID=104269 RepID=UPI0038944A76
MNIRLFSILVSFGLIFAACKSEKKTQKKSLQDYMVGSWETSYIKIDYPTYKKADSAFVFEDDFSSPTSGRAQSKYNADGTFSAWFKQPDSSKVGETTGNWKTKGDSLYIDYPYLGKQVEAWYLIKPTKEGFEGTVIYDWDDDGESDDTLFMKSKKLH